MDPHKEWDGLRKEARLIESDIDNKLGSLSKCGKSAPLNQDTGDRVPLLTNDSEPDPDVLFDRITRDIESLLSRLQDVNNQMAHVSDVLNTPSVSYTFQRHRDILNDYTKEFRTAQANTRIHLDRDRLFQSSNRNRETRVSITSSAATALLHKEADHSRNAEMMVDEQIETVMRTRDNMNKQKQTLKAIHSQMTTIANRFPVIHSLIQRINVKKRKDSIILGTVIGTCLFLFVIFTF